MKRALLITFAAAGLAVGCGSDDDDEPTSADGQAASNGALEGRREAKPAEAAATETAPAEPPPAGGESAAAPASRRARGPLVKLRRSQFGPVLFDGRDRALYLFTRDSGKKSRCYGACAAAWPPFFAKGRPRAARGVDRSLLGTVERRDGRRQVTYKGQPLYFYVSDPKGEVLCNDIVEFGGTWYALDAKGNPPA
jgi:predicted lipoprotein with Yx(FWY)xxD motif